MKLPGLKLLGSSMQAQQSREQSAVTHDLQVSRAKIPLPTFAIHGIQGLSLTKICRHVTCDGVTLCAQRQ
eukprot:5456170-Amphidinium_carterae.2